MELISPPILKIGDTVAIVAPARKVKYNEIEPAIRMLESWGLKVVFGENLFGEHNQFSGTDSERASDFQSMIEDPTVKAIVCARGGYGTIRLLDFLNLRSMQRNPKWIVGYSDITVLHSYLNSWYKVETIHGIMPINFPMDEKPNDSTESLRMVLFGHNPVYNFPAHKFNRNGVATGKLCGGNLSILYSVACTDADINTDNQILLIEDLDEYLYHIDRMMMNLKRSGKLKNLAALVVGGMTQMHDNTVPFGLNALEIIRDAVAEYGYPVCYRCPVGHQEDNVALIMGRTISLSVTEEGSNLTFLPRT